MDEREAELRRRVADSPADPQLLDELARVVGEQRGRKEEAVELRQRQVAAVEPAGLAAALLALGRAQVEARREADAIATLQRCTAVEELPEALELLGELLRRAGELDPAVRALRRAAELQPRAVQPGLALVACLDAAGRSEEAQEVLQSIQQAASGDPAVAALIRQLIQRRG